MTLAQSDDQQRDELLEIKPYKLKICPTEEWESHGCAATISRTALTSQQLTIKIKEYDKQPDQSNSCLTGLGYLYYTFLLGICIIKVSASAGQRIYGVRDLLSNPNLIMPLNWSDTNALIGAAVISAGDLHMNSFTRIPSTLGFYDISKLRWHFDDFKTLHWSKKILTIVIVVASIGSSLFGSLSSFLGIATLLELISENQKLILAIAATGAGANFITNLGFRVRKTFENTSSLLCHGFDKKTAWEYAGCIFITLLATSVFMGNCDYGTSHSLRHIFKLLNWYDGQPNTSSMQPEWENKIYTTTNISLIIAGVSYLFGPIAQMFRHDAATPDRSGDIIVAKTSIVKLRTQLDNHYLTCGTKAIKVSAPKNCCNKTWHHLKAAVLTARAGFFYTLGGIFSLFIALELLGNGLSSLNGACGLISRLTDVNPVKALTPTRWLIFLPSLIIATLSTKPYWDFNGPEWREKVSDALIKSLFALVQFYSPWAISQGSANDAHDYATKILNINATHPRTLTDDGTQTGSFGRDNTGGTASHPMGSV